MADLTGPFDSVPWSQTEWYDFAPTWAPSGIIGTPAASVGVGDFAVTASGLTLTVACIGDRAWVDGSGYKPDTDKTLPVTANANASLSRRDRIVIRRDLAAKTIAVVRLTGTPASGTPAPPALTRTSGGAFDVPICSFLVPPNSGTGITDIVDERGFIDPGGAGPLAFQTPAARDANFPTPTRSLRAATYGDGRFWLYNGVRWVKDGGSTELIASTLGATLGGPMGNTGGFVTAGSISVPAHVPGTLNLQFRGSWAAPANAASSWQLQYPGGSPVAWHRTANNAVAGAPVAVVLDGYVASDGSAQTLIVGATVDPAGVSITPVAGSFAVWLL